MKYTIPTILRNQFLSFEAKRALVKQAEIIVQEKLSEYNILFPWKVDLDLIRDVYIRNTGGYARGSLVNGMIMVSLNSMLIEKDLKDIAKTILHEYGHAIYEYIWLIDAEMGIHFIELSKTRNFLYIFQQQKRGNNDLMKETFCDAFAYYLLTPLNFDEDFSIHMKAIIEGFSRLKVNQY